jgi:hydrogenase expression/formation protein HypC
MCVAVPYQVVEVNEERARVSRDGRVTVVSLLAMTEPLHPGDWVLVHSGFVLAALTPAEAAELSTMRTDGGAP